MHQNYAAAVVKEEQSQVRETKYLGEILCKISKFLMKVDATFLAFTCSMIEFSHFEEALHC